MKTARQQVGVAPDNSPLYGQTFIGMGYGKSSSQSGKSLSRPSQKVSLSAEEKAKVQSLKQEHVQSLHRSFLSSQSETPENSST